MGNITFGGADPDIRFTLVYQREANGRRMIPAHLRAVRMRIEKLRGATGDPPAITDVALTRH